MIEKPEDLYPELWHYTNADGIHGILKDKVLWATNILYLNDVEEFNGFIEKRLRTIITESVRESLRNPPNDKSFEAFLESQDGAEKYTDYVTNWLCEGIKQALHLYEPYVMSFCKPYGVNMDGELLSQWRGYGKDGGYALVFDTKVLDDLLHNETSEYVYLLGNFGDVDYDDNNHDKYEETIEWENKISSVINEIIFIPDKEVLHEKLSELFDPILQLATRHKHGGFHEEREIRLTLVPALDDKLINELRNERGRGEKKDIEFRTRNGMLIPYIKALNFDDPDKARKLIKKVVVGPHNEKHKRKDAVKKLLRQYGYEDTVEVSDIPFSDF